MALQWKDKRLVTMLSSVFYAKYEGEYRILGNGDSTIIPKPVVISQYTKYMGGVGKADHYCGSYAFLRKTAKWWRKMFFWIFEVAVVNSFILYNIRRKEEELEKCHTQSVSKKFCPTVGRKDSEQKRQKAWEKFHYKGSERLH